MRPLKTSQIILVAALVAILSLLPLAFAMIPPMVDYPNHLARCAILAGLHNSADLRAMYEPRNALLPNMAMDAVVVPLSAWISPLLAGKIFCGLVLMCMLFGGVALSYALFRRITIWSFAPALLLFNHIFIFGFVNYLFGCGLVLWGLAAWVYMRDRALAWRIAVGASMAILLFLSHLVAMFLFGVAVAGYEIALWVDDPKRTKKSLAMAAASVGSLFVLPAVLLMGSPTGSEVGGFHPSSLGDKLDMVLAGMRTDGNRLDVIFNLLLLAAVIGLVVTKAVKIEPRMRFAVLGTVAAFLLLPEEFRTCSCVDIRIPIVIGFLLASGTSVRLDKKLLPKLCVGALVFAFGLRSFQISRDWSLADRTSREVLGDLADLPDRAVVFTAADNSSRIFRQDNWSPPLVHLAVAEAIDKPLFFPQIFALPTQHPLAIKPELRRLEKFQDTEPFRFDDHDSLGDVLGDCRKEALSLHDVPPNLGPDPSFYVFVITTPGKSSVIDHFDHTELIVQRPRYTLYKLTGIEQASHRRQQLWARFKRQHIVRLGTKAETSSQALPFERSTGTAGTARILR